MSQTVFIPGYNQVLELTEDWSVELTWESQNLVMLKAFKLTGMKKVNAGHRLKQDVNGNYVRDDKGAYVYEQYTRNETVVNPLFKDYDGNTTPALVTFPAGTRFRFSRFWADGAGVYEVYLKCVDSPKKGIAGKNILLSRDRFNGVVGTWTP